MSLPAEEWTPEQQKDSEQRAALANELAEQALVPFAEHLSEEGLALLRAELVLQLLGSVEGEGMLERLLPGPIVDRSGEILRSEGTSAKGKSR